MNHIGFGAYGDEGITSNVSSLTTPAVVGSNILSETKDKFTKMLMLMAGLGLVLYIGSKKF